VVLYELIAGTRPYRLERADAFWRGFDAGNRASGEAALWLGRCRLALDRRSEDESVRLD
jgi:hypothetical protein